MALSSALPPRVVVAVCLPSKWRGDGVADHTCQSSIQPSPATAANERKSANVTFWTFFGAAWIPDCHPGSKVLPALRPPRACALKAICLSSSMANRLRTMAAGCVICAHRTCHRAPKVFFIVRFVALLFLFYRMMPHPGAICRFDVCSACQARAASAPPGAAFSPPPGIHQHLHFDLNEARPSLRLILFCDDL